MKTKHSIMDVAEIRPIEKKVLIYGFMTNLQLSLLVKL